VQLVGDALQLSLDGGQALQLLVLQREPKTRVNLMATGCPHPQSYRKPCLGLVVVGGAWSLRGKVLVAGDYRGGFHEKLPEASPMSDRASASWLQDTAGQGGAHQ